jgi:hypothetical protein
MTLKAEDIKISFDLDEFTWGDMEDIQSRDLIKILDVCERLGKIKDKAKSETRSILRQLGRNEIYKIIDLLTQAMKESANPPDETGKN